MALTKPIVSVVLFGFVLAAVVQGRSLQMHKVQDGPVDYERTILSDERGEVVASTDAVDAQDEDTSDLSSESMDSFKFRGVALPGGIQINPYRTGIQPLLAPPHDAAAAITHPTRWSNLALIAPPEFPLNGVTAEPKFGPPEPALSTPPQSTPPMSSDVPIEIRIQVPLVRLREEIIFFERQQDILPPPDTQIAGL